MQKVGVSSGTLGVQSSKLQPRYKLDLTGRPVNMVEQKFVSPKSNDLANALGIITKGAQTVTQINKEAERQRLIEKKQSQDLANKEYKRIDLEMKQKEKEISKGYDEQIKNAKSKEEIDLINKSKKETLDLELGRFREDSFNKAKEMGLEIEDPFMKIADTNTSIRQIENIKSGLNDYVTQRKSEDPNLKKETIVKEYIDSNLEKIITSQEEGISDTIKMYINENLENSFKNELNQAQQEDEQNQRQYISDTLTIGINNNLVNNSKDKNIFQNSLKETYSNGKIMGMSNKEISNIVIPNAIKEAVNSNDISVIENLKGVKVDGIDLYELHRPQLDRAIKQIQNANKEANNRDIVTLEQNLQSDNYIQTLYDRNKDGTQVFNLLEKDVGKQYKLLTGKQIPKSLYTKVQTKLKEFSYKEDGKNIYNKYKGSSIVGNEEKIRQDLISQGYDLEESNKIITYSKSEINKNVINAYEKNDKIGLLENIRMLNGEVPNDISNNFNNILNSDIINMEQPEIDKLAEDSSMFIYLKNNGVMISKDSVRQNQNDTFNYAMNNMLKNQPLKEQLINAQLLANVPNKNLINIRKQSGYKDLDKNIKDIVTVDGRFDVNDYNRTIGIAERYYSVNGVPPTKDELKQMIPKKISYHKGIYGIRDEFTINQEGTNLTDDNIDGVLENVATEFNVDKSKLQIRTLNNKNPNYLGVFIKEENKPARILGNINSVDQVNKFNKITEDLETEIKLEQAEERQKIFDRQKYNKHKDIYERTGKLVPNSLYDPKIEKEKENNYNDIIGELGLM